MTLCHTSVIRIISDRESYEKTDVVTIFLAMLYTAMCTHEPHDIIRDIV